MPVKNLVLSPVAGTQRQYAQRRKAMGWRGGTDAAVCQRVKAGLLAEAMRPDGLIDFAAADASWPSGQPVIEQCPKSPAPSESGPDPQAGKSKLDLEKEKLVEEIEGRRLKNEEHRRMLIRADEVLAAQTERAEAEREAWLNWPSQISATLAARLGVTERDLFVSLDAEVRKHLSARSSRPIESTTTAAA